ncbi:MAG: rhodanese-like domain-containing protein [Cocleimonas sp.]
MQEYIDFASNHPLMIIGFIAILGFIVKTELSRLNRKYKQVGVNQAVMLMNDDKTAIVDVREDKEVSGGFIKGAQHIKLADLPSRIGNISKDKNVPVLVYCRSGNRSGHACHQISKAGYENVSNLAGGIMAWESANLPITKR